MNQESSKKIESEALVKDEIEPETEEVKPQSSAGKEELEPLFGED